MNSKITLSRLTFFFLSTLILQSCSTLYDARPKMLKRDGITEESTQKGKELLDQVWKKQGVDRFDQHKVYSFTGFDTWKDNKIGEIGKIWPDFKTTIEFKFKVDTLDGNIHFIDGQNKGTIAGFYDSKYYETTDGVTEYQDENDESNIRAAFGIHHIQYFFELLTRLRQAPIISYAGEEEFNGEYYDLVFVTWGKAEPHMEHDQYLLWINKETGFLDYSEYSVRDVYVKPIGYKRLGSNIHYTDYREIEGVWISHKQLVYPIKKRKKQEKFIHNLKVSNFQFDSFDPSELTPKM